MSSTRTPAPSKRGASPSNSSGTQAQFLLIAAVWLATIAYTLLRPSSGLSEALWKKSRTFHFTSHTVYDPPPPVEVLKGEEVSGVHQFEAGLLGLCVVAILLQVLLSNIQSSPPSTSNVSLTSSNTITTGLSLSITVLLSSLAWWAYSSDFILLSSLHFALAIYGVWVNLFAEEGHRNRAGKDVRVSGFPFENKKAEEKKNTSQKKWI